MTKSIQLAILQQPNDTTCGPTCLHAVYNYFDHIIPLEQVIAEIPSLEGGGTLATLLGCHALRRGFKAQIYTYNLKVFDPTWFSAPLQRTDGGESARESPAIEATREQAFNAQLMDRIQSQMAVKRSARLHTASRAYLEFLQLGGTISMEDLNAYLIRRYLKRAVPILTGLSATYLYRNKREIGPDCIPDDIQGYPCGHFVVLAGYDKQRKTVRVADPYGSNPLGEKHTYEVELDRLVCAILLGVLTYDANLLIIEPNNMANRRSVPASL